MRISRRVFCIHEPASYLRKLMDKHQTFFLLRPLLARKVLGFLALEISWGASQASEFLQRLGVTQPTQRENCEAVLLGFERCLTKYII